VLLRLPELNFNDDKGGKPVGIMLAEPFTSFTFSPAGAAVNSLACSARRRRSSRRGI
jgi:hypothetical protein